MASIGNLSAKLILDTNQFSSGATRAARELGGLESKFTTFGSKLTSFGSSMSGVLATLGVGFSLHQVTSSIGRSIEQIGDLYDAATKLGIGTDVLAGLRYGAEQSGVAVEALDKALQMMLRNISSEGKVFAELGLDAKSLASLSARDSLGLIADRMSQLENASDRVRVAMEIFGRTGADLIPYLEGGSTAIGSMADEAERLGLAINHLDAAKIEATGDAIARAGAAWSGLKMRAAGLLAPALAQTADAATYYLGGGVSGIPPLVTGERSLRARADWTQNLAAKATSTAQTKLDESREALWASLVERATAVAKQRLAASERALRLAMRGTSFSGGSNELPAVEKGTVEAARVMAEVRRGETDRMLDIARKQLEANERTARGVEDIAKRDEVTVVEESI